MQCVHQSLNGTCAASCSSLPFGVSLFLGPALTRQSGAANSSSPSILSPPSYHIPSCPSSTPFNPVPSNFLFSAPSHLHNTADLTGLCESRLTTHCPCQLKTGPVSSRQIHMSIVYTPLFTSSLIIVPTRIFRMCGFFASTTTMFPTRTTFCIEM